MRSSAAEPDDGGEGTFFSLEAYAAAANSDTRAAAARRTAALVAEPLLAGLPNRGTYRHGVKEFTALARYLFDGEPAKTASALEAGRFRYGALEFVREAALKPATGPTISISDFARATGTPKQTVAYRVGQFRPRFELYGKRKRYYLSELQALFGASTGR